jgi:hypothetical protein
VLSVVMFVGTLVLVPVLLARVRPDYFITDPGSRPSTLNPAIRLAGRVGKNVIGVVLVAFGVLMLVLPGQGILTVLVGLAMLDIPGKRRLERRIVSNRRVRRSIDWIRRRAGQPPMELDLPPAEPASPTGSSRSADEPLAHPRSDPTRPE